MRKLSWLFLFFLMVQTVIAHPDNFYIEIKKNELEIGQYEGKNFKKRPLKSYPFQKENIEEIKQILFAKGQENILYYFHCLYGGVRSFHKNSLKKLNENNETNKIISIVWHAEKVEYKKNWHQSINQSDHIRELLFRLWSMENKNNKILCHSMGHRIFEGVLKGVDNQDVRFDVVLFAAGDLDVTVFDESLKKLPNISEKIVVYVHKTDRLLKTSAKKHGRKRLGLDGLEEDENLGNIENMERIDVTNSSGRRFIRTTNHSYFKRDRKVLGDITAVLENELAKRKEELKRLGTNSFEMK